MIIIKKILKPFIRIGKICLFKTDRLFFDGRIKKRLHRVDVEIDEGHTFLNEGKPHSIELDNGRILSVKRAITTRVSVRDLITMQIYYPMRFRSWVLAVHYMYMEYLDGKNEVGLDLEKKLLKRLYGEADLAKQNERIANICSQAFDCIEPIDVDRDMRLIDGSLRLAVALYEGYDFINVRCCDRSILRHRYVYGRDYLWSIGFSDSELQIVETMVERLLEECRYYNTCIIWPPAKNIYDDLQRALSEYEPDNITIYDYWDTTMTFEELSGFIDMAYKKDDAQTWAIQMKSEFMYKASQIDNDIYPIRFLRIRIKNPDYIVKPVSGQPYSQESLRCKETLRAIFRDKVKFYERDVVIHISDNYLQSQYLWLLTHVNRDLSRLFLTLDENEIVYTATDEKGRTFDLTHAQFAFGNKACIQIFTENTCLDIVHKIVLEFVNKHFTGQWIRIENFERGCNILLENECILRIRIEPYSIND